MDAIRRPGYPDPLPFVEGELLDQAEFRRRDDLLPEGKWAELVGGIVAIVPRVVYAAGAAKSSAGGWLGVYRMSIPGVVGLINVSTILGEKAQVQPDHELLILEALGGRSRVVDGMIVGPPELVVEVSKATRSLDLGTKKDEYEKAGVREYLFVEAETDEVRWFALDEGRFEELPRGADGLIRSRVFPGLRLDPKALVQGDVSGLIAALGRGLASDDHVRFVADLAGREA